MTLHEALRALACLHPTPGMPLVEHGLWHSTSTVRPLVTPARQMSIPTRPRVSGVGLRDPSLVVPVGRRVDIKAGPFGSNSLSLQGTVAGCLAQNWEGWLKIRAEKWILNILREGYRIPFSAPHPSGPTL